MIRGKLRGDRAERFLARMHPPAMRVAFAHVFEDEQDRDRLAWTVEQQRLRLDNQQRGHERNLRHIAVLENSLKSLRAQVKGGAKTTWQGQRKALQKVARELAERVALLESVKETAEAARLLSSARVLQTLAQQHVAELVKVLEAERKQFRAERIECNELREHCDQIDGQLEREMSEKRQLVEDKLRLENTVKELTTDAERWREPIMHLVQWATSITGSQGRSVNFRYAVDASLFRATLRACTDPIAPGKLGAPKDG